MKDLALRTEIAREIDRALDAEEAASQARKIESPSQVDRMSSAGDCPRMRWARRQGIEQDLDGGFPAKLLRVFRAGHALEDEVLSLLRLAGFRIFDEQRTVSVGPGWVGHIDSLGQREGEPVKLIEVKTANTKSFEIYLAEGVAAHQPRYVAQATAYMGALIAEGVELQSCLFAVYHKDTSALYCEEIFFSPAAFSRLQADNALVLGETLPEIPEGFKPSRAPCNWCDFKLGCRGGTFELWEPQSPS